MVNLWLAPEQMLFMLFIYIEFFNFPQDYTGEPLQL